MVTDNRQDLIENTILTQTEIAALVGVIPQAISMWVIKHYDKAFRKHRFPKIQSGERNHQYGLRDSLNASYKHGLSSHGYPLTRKPDWFTGSPRCARVQVHQVVYCETHGLTEIPEGYCVHHRDENKENFDPDNLQLMTKSEHQAHHAGGH